MRFGVIGCGRWGSFIAWYLCGLGHEVTLFGRPGSARMRALRETRSNGMLTLPAGVALTDDLTRALSGDAVVISIGSQSLRGLCEQLSPLGISDKLIVLCMKGLEQGTGKRLTQIVGEELPGADKVAVWLGPGHVQEFVAGVPNCMVIDSASEDVKSRLIGELTGPLIRFYYGNDIIGSELGAAAKNVIGIAAGMLDGLSRSSLKGALMSRGTREVARLIAALGGNELSAYGLCHLGDYEATVFSRFSHNRAFGEALVRGESFPELAEGTYTARAMVALSEQYGVDLPIARAVCSVIYDGKSADEALGGLFMRSLKREF